MSEQEAMYEVPGSRLRELSTDIAHLQDVNERLRFKVAELRELLLDVLSESESDTRWRELRERIRAALGEGEA